MLLAALLSGGILTLWVRSRWAVSLFEIGAYALLLGWLAAGIWIPGRRIHLHSLLIPVAAVPLWGALQIATGQTVYAWDTFNGITTWLAYLAVAIVTLQVCSQRKYRWRFLSGALWFGLIMSAVAVVQLYTSPDNVFWIFPLDREVTRHPLLGPFTYHNRYACFIELLAPLLLWRWLRDGGRWWLTAAAVMAASAVAGGSRAGAAILLLEFVTFFLIAYRRHLIPRRKILPGVLHLVLLLSLFCGVVGTDYLAGRVARLNPLEDDRLELVRTSLEMTAARPWMGSGLQTWATAYGEFAHEDAATVANQAHCDWVQWAAEGGIPLLLTMSWLAAISVRAAWREPWSLGVVMVFLHGLFDFPMQEAPAFSALVLAMAAAAVCGHRTARGKRENTGLRPQPNREETPRVTPVDQCLQSGGVGGRRNNASYDPAGSCAELSQRANP